MLSSRHTPGKKKKNSTRTTKIPYIHKYRKDRLEACLYFFTSPGSGKRKGFATLPVLPSE